MLARLALLAAPALLLAAGCVAPPASTVAPAAASAPRSQAQAQRVGHADPEPAPRCATHPFAEVYLSLLLEHDPSVQVRLEAVAASGTRDLAPLVPALVHAATTDPAVAVRQRAVRLLGTELARLPSVLAALRRVAEREVDAGLRSEAVALVAPFAGWER